MHPRVTSAANPTEAFMELINRRTLVPGDPSEADGIPGKELLLHFGFNHDAEHQSVIEKANRLLGIYESYPVKEFPNRLPPPIWLRLLPICLEVTRGLGLWGSDNDIKLRFVSFAMEPVKKGKDLFETFVNINSDAPRLNIEEHKLSNGKFSKSLNRELFGSFYSERLGDIGRLTSSVWWGIRFRTSESNEEPRKPNWLDVRVDPNQLGHEYKAEVRFPYKISADARTGLERLFKDWAFDAISPDERDAVSLNTASEQIFAYVKVNEKAFPNRRLPDTGMDCLICPGIFWSADPFLWGTGMTIVYGFEGYLEEDISNLLLSITQQLMMAPTIFSQVIKLKESSERAGRYNLLHNLPKDIQAVISNINDYNEKREDFLRKYVEANILPDDIPSIPSPDKLGVTLMFLAAEDPDRRQLKQLPIDLANGLSKPWSVAFLTKFVNRVVWDAVWGRVITDDKVKKALKSEELLRDRLMEGEGAFQQPELVMPEAIHVKHAEHLYPLFLVALRSAYQHSYLCAVLSQAIRGRVELTYEESGGIERVHIKNSGAPEDDENMNQQGWLRDIAIFEGLTDGWFIEIKDRSRGLYSAWQNDRWHGFPGYWTTTIARALERVDE